MQPGHGPNRAKKLRDILTDVAGEGVIVPHEDEGAIPERDEPASRGTGPERAP